MDGGSKCAMRRDTRRPPVFCRRSLEACAHMRVTTAHTVFGSFCNFLQLVENASLYIYIYRHGGDVCVKLNPCKDGGRGAGGPGGTAPPARTHLETQCVGMSICIYIYMYVYMYVYACIRTCMYIYLFWIYVCVHRYVDFIVRNG